MRSRAGISLLRFRDLDEFIELRRSERRGEEFLLDRLGHRLVEAGNLVGRTAVRFRIAGRGSIIGADLER